MNKQNIIYWVIIVALVIILTIFLVLLINQNTEKTSEPERTTYVLPPKIVKALFNCSVEEFFSTYRETYQYVEDYRKHASVDKEGNLVLRLTKEQEEVTLYRLNDCLGRARSAGIEISDDYTYVSYVCTSSEFFKNYPFLLHYELCFRQLFSGKDPATISITYNIIAKTTKKVICNSTFPESGFNFDGGDPDWY